MDLVLDLADLTRKPIEGAALLHYLSCVLDAQAGPTVLDIIGAAARDPALPLLFYRDVCAFAGYRLRQLPDTRPELSDE